MPENINQNPTYKVGNITFIVTPVYKTVQGETIKDILLKLMKTDAMRERIKG